MTAAYRTVLVIWGLGAVATLAPPANADEVPNLAGTWEWSWKDRNGATHSHVLEMEGANTKLAARELFDEAPPVKVTGLTLDGKTLRFTVVRDDHRADYSGVVADADTIGGTVKVTDNAKNAEAQSNEYPWKARRRTKPKQPTEPKPEKPEG